MFDGLDNLILDLLEWLGSSPRPYSEVLDAWRTSCPRFPVWEDANDRGFIERHDAPGRGQYKGWVIAYTTDGRTLERVEPHNRGSAENPLSADDVRAKFRENAARTLDARAIEAIIKKVDGLEREAEIGRLVDLCVR